MAEHRLNFICRKCGHHYTSAFSTGPRAVCPNCKYDPTFMELMDSQRESPWPYVLLLLVIVAIIAMLFGFGVI